MFYGERSGGIRTYLDEKARHAAATGAFEHHLIVPGRAERHTDSRHELASLRLASSNGYRAPLGVRSLRTTLRRIAPDVVLVHDPYWGTPGASDLVAETGARVVAVHHSSSALHAARLPGPDGLYLSVFRAWFRHAYRNVDAVMSVVDTLAEAGRAADLPLRFGLNPAFTPRAAARRREHVLCVGRLSREKGVSRLLEAAALERWPLRFAGTGPLERGIRLRAGRLGIGDRVSILPYVSEPARLARLYAEASCVVMAGEHETFGLVALEAAASGAAVVACETAPSAGLLGGRADLFAPGDTGGLVQAIRRARRRVPDPAAAERLAERFSWRRAFEAELADLERLAA
jgi:alpha-1,6-mannosyltransferase